jgi:hypothetical protein
MLLSGPISCPGEPVQPTASVVAKHNLTAGRKWPLLGDDFGVSNDGDSPGDDHRRISSCPQHILLVLERAFREVRIRGAKSN